MELKKVDVPGPLPDRGTVTSLQDDDLLPSAALFKLERKLDAAVAELSEVRSAVLGQTPLPREDQRLKRLEDQIRESRSDNELILETVRSFEALVSVDLVKRINQLIDERLTVVADAQERRDAALRRQRAALLLCGVLGVFLALEIHNGSVGTRLAWMWNTALMTMADLGGWIEKMVG